MKKHHIRLLVSRRCNNPPCPMSTPRHLHSSQYQMIQVPAPATCEDDDRPLNTLQRMFGIDTKQSKLVSHEAVNSQTEPNSPRNEARHSPITVLSRRGKGNGDGGVVRFAVFADLTVGKISESKFFLKTLENLKIPVDRIFVNHWNYIVLIKPLILTVLQLLECL